MNVTAVLTNYNMVERTDALVEHMLQKEQADVRLSIVVVDNASDITKPSQYTTLRLEKNVQTTGGWLAGLDYADKHCPTADAYWIMITSGEFIGRPVLSDMLDILTKPDCVGVHPALTKDSGSWAQLLTQGSEARPVGMIDNIAALWKADWFDGIGRFDPAMIYAWGSDLETCYFARSQGKSLYVSEPAGMRKITNIGYQMGRMNMTSDERHKKALDNMTEVLSAKYGANWHDLMYGWQKES